MGARWLAEIDERLHDHDKLGVAPHPPPPLEDVLALNYLPPILHAMPLRGGGHNRDLMYDASTD